MDFKFIFLIKDFNLTSEDIVKAINPVEQGVAGDRACGHWKGRLFPFPAAGGRPAPPRLPYGSRWENKRKWPTSTSRRKLSKRRHHGARSPWAPLKLRGWSAFTAVALPWSDSRCSNVGENYDAAVAPPLQLKLQEIQNEPRQKTKETTQ